ncbi:kinase-like protein [Gigaspora margarita]|uniref:Kinase-like protein n=1 Tax=Gigaspora margarita TaxID=4874 RepID=A0A8H3X7V9_GIGMA|nr:kinase-like protein [Gigaspora margarita]
MELSSPVCDIKFSDLEIVFENSLKGGFGEVYKGKLRGHIIAAKYVKRETPTNLKDFNRELKALRLSEKCKSNIIKFFGLSHALLADFGLSKSLLEPATISVVIGVQAYVDPILLSGRLNYTDKYEKYSDIYSFGVLMWETYTCRSPLEGKLSSDLTHKLCLGLREKREKGMPMQYIDIYEKCWSPDPSLRPEISEILEILSNTVVQQDDLTSEMQLYNSSELTLSDSFLTLIEKACQIENFYSSYNNMQLNQRMCKQLGRKLIFFIHETDCGISLERLKDKYVKLLEKFHESASSLQFNIPVDDNKEIDDVHKDIDETIEFIQTYRSNFGSGSLFQLIEKTSKDIQNTANNKLLEDVDIQEPYNNENVITKEFEPDDKKMFWIRVAVLKNLKNFANVAKFYGAINLGNHRLVSDKSGVLPINTGYVAPEIFSRNKRTFIDAQACVENLDEKYNFTCEVYCFGILLWELAHEKDPYQYGLKKNI